MNLPRLNRTLRSAGFTLVEVMIALLIGLIGIVVMMQTFAVSEGFKRTATSGTDAQINGAVGMYMIQRELRMAGFAMNNLMVQGCTSVVVYNNKTGVSINMPLVPFYLNPPLIPAGDANTDTILIAFGNSTSSVSGMQLLNAQTNNNSLPLASNFDSFQTGDLFVTVTPNGANPSCVLHEATATTNAATNCGLAPTLGGAYNGSSVDFTTNNYQQHEPQGCVPTVPTYNKGSAITDASGNVQPMVVAGTSGLVYNLGNATIHVYAIRGATLTMCDWVASDCTAVANYTPVVDDIVSLRAVYGMNLTPSLSATQGDGVITPSRNDLSTNVYLPSRVLSVTMELTARSALKEKPNSAGNCVTTPNANKPDLSQTWIYDSMAGANIDLSTVSTDWSCYRYKLYQTTVPLRNSLWRP